MAHFYILKNRRYEAILKLINDQGDELSVSLDDSCGALPHFSRARMATFPAGSDQMQGEEVLGPTALEFIQTAAAHLGYYLVNKDKAEQAPTGGWRGAMLELSDNLQAERDREREEQARAQALAEAMEVIRKVRDASYYPDAATECLEAVEALTKPAPRLRYRLDQRNVRFSNSAALEVRERMISDLADKWYALEAGRMSGVQSNEQTALEEAISDLGGSIVYPYEQE